MDHDDALPGPRPTPASRPALPPPLVPGLVLGRLLGAGAHGSVWSARDPATGERVAVKLLGPDADREPSVHARAAHPGVVRLRNVVDRPGGRALVLDLAEGGSLAGLLAARGRLAPGECVTVVVGLARTVADLHARGLAHGDLSPGNVVLTADGRPLLTDLGAAAVVGRDVAAAGWGTPGFADPAGGPAADPARDVHGLGALLRACLGVAPDGAPAPNGPPPGGPAGTLLSVADLCTDPDAARRPSADDVARLVWDAAPARPVRLPGGPAVDAVDAVDAVAADAAGDAAGAGGTVAPAGPVSGAVPPGALPWEVPGPGAGDVTRRVREAARSAADAERARRDDVRGRRRRRAARVAAGAAVLAATGLAAAGVLAVRAGREAPSDAEVARVVDRLAQGRAAAFRAASRAALAGVDEPGSPAMAADAALVERLTDRGLRLDGLSFAVRDVLVHERRHDRVAVTATVVTSAHRQVEADGDVAARVPAEEPQRVRLVIVRHDAGWWVRSAAAG